jgi:AraC-like DNA-binding protein
MHELAALCAVSVPHLIEIFRRSFGASPHKFLLQHRLGLARERLSQRLSGITELALELGFSSSQHFAGAYHREFGCSPSAHRKFVEVDTKKGSPHEPNRLGRAKIRPAALKRPQVFTKN